MTRGGRHSVSRRALPLLLTATALLAAVGCDVSSSGDFNNVRFTPVGTVFAVADRHDLVASGGSLIAVKRSEEQQSLSLFLSGAVLNANEDWRQLTAERLLRMRKDLATLDGLLLSGIPMAAALAGDDVELRLVGSGREGEGTFDVAMVVELPGSEVVDEQGFGADVNIKVLFDDAVVEPRGGQISARVEIKRERADFQTSGEVATGEVTLGFSAPIVPERIGKSNLSLAAPVMRCAAAAGPASAGRCRNEPPDPFAGATGTLVEP